MTTISTKMMIKKDVLNDVNEHDDEDDDDGIVRHW